MKCALQPYTTRHDSIVLETNIEYTVKVGFRHWTSDE